MIHGYPSENKLEPDLDPVVVEEGMRLVEDLLRTWASSSAVQDDGDVVMGDAEANETPEAQLEALKKCVEQFRPQLEGNAWVQRLMTTLA